MAVCERAISVAGDVLWALVIRCRVQRYDPRHEEEAVELKLLPGRAIYGTNKLEITCMQSELDSVMW